tara:strand:+ start:185 stop:604 length:420 start_codon:yes stop_codon:yes gene_type:complete
MKKNSPGCSCCNQVGCKCGDANRLVNYEFQNVAAACNCFWSTPSGTVQLDAFVCIGTTVVQWDYWGNVTMILDLTGAKPQATVQGSQAWTTGFCHGAFILQGSADFDTCDPDYTLDTYHSGWGPLNDCVDPGVTTLRIW